MNQEQQMPKEMNKAERQIVRQQEKELQQRREKNRQRMASFGRWGLLALIPAVFIGWITWKIMTSPVRPEGDLVLSREIHWHAKLDIKVRGKDVEIPANIGIPVGQPGAHPENMHTHATDHVVHIEKLPPVYKNDLRIANFFGVWGKKFDSTCIVDECVQGNEKVIMKVNGKENSDFENYLLKDLDKVEITLE